MKETRLLIENYYFQESYVKSVEDYVKKSDNSEESDVLSTSLELEVQFRPHKTDIERCQVMLNIQLPEDEGDRGPDEAYSRPYDMRVSVLGSFRIFDATSLSKEDIEKLLSVDALSVLYSAIREHVLSITTRSTNGVFCLPPIEFSRLEIENLLLPPKKGGRTKKAISKQ